MYLHKTTGMAVGATAGKAAPTVQNAPALHNATASKPPPQTASLPASASPAPRSVAALIAAAGLPMDKLSASIVSFARFFSLPLKPELMAAIRRQALAPQSATTQTDSAKHAATKTDSAKPATAETAEDSTVVAKNREALSLAAAAAESKGVTLHPKGLEGFAEAVDPEWQERHDTGGRQRGRQGKDRSEPQDEHPAKTGPITASRLREMALESAEKDPLLSILNRLPGKNGQRWIVFPLNFCEGGREFRVSMRILLETDQTLNRAARMTLDIAESGVTESSQDGRRWLFVLEPANGPSVKGLSANRPKGRLSANRLTVYLQPELPPKTISPFVRTLSHFVGIESERILVKGRPESWCGETACEDDLPRSINEAV